MEQIPNIKEAIHDLKNKISEVDHDFNEWFMTGDEYREPSWLIEVCFLQLLAITEALELEEFRKMIYVEYGEIKISKGGFLKVGRTPDGDPYSLVVSKIRRFIYALESFFPKENHTKITKDLLQIIRDIHYVITDKVLFRYTFQRKRCSSSH
jgi:hypothetical protein